MYTISKWSETFENADSRKRKRLGWVLFPSGCDSVGYIELMSYGAEGVAAFGTFASLCQWSATSCQSFRGILCRSDGTELTENQLASILRQPISVVQRSLVLLVKVGWLKTENTGDTDSDDPYLPPPADDLPPPATSSEKMIALLKEKEKEKEKEKLFNCFYEAFNNKKAKAAAIKAFAKVIEGGTDPAMLIEKAGAFSAACKAAGSISPYPATWLNGRRWEDEGLPTAPAKPNAAGTSAFDLKRRNRKQDVIYEKAKSGEWDFRNGVYVDLSNGDRIDPETLEVIK